VDKITKDPTGWNIYVNGQAHFAPATKKLIKDGKPLEEGMTVRRGDALTDGPINPRELLPLTDVPTVQNHLVSELYDGIYRDERVRRRNIETVVRSLTNLAQVRDPGEHTEYMTGDIVRRSVIDEHNRNLEPGQLPVDAKPVLKGMAQGVLDAQDDWLARLNFRRLKETIMEGAAKGWQTDLHGTNPVPAYAYGAEFGEGTKREPWKY
jgi:DNA-directed RNA polymerase subunit beta'